MIPEISVRLQTVNKALVTLDMLLRMKDIFRVLKMMIFNTIVMTFKGPTKITFFRKSSFQKDMWPKAKWANRRMAQKDTRKSV